MDCNQDFAEHWLPNRWTILGVELPAFKVGHLLLLDRIQSPFVTGEDVHQEDLLLAVCICARPYADGADSLARGPSVLWRLWAWKHASKMNSKEGYFQTEAKKFHAMLTLAREPIQQIYHDAKGEKTYAPNILVLVGDLMSHFGYSESDALEMPLSKAHYLREKKLMDERAASWPEPWELGKA